MRYKDFAAKHIPRYQPPRISKSKPKPQVFTYKPPNYSGASIGRWSFLRRSMYDPNVSVYSSLDPMYTDSEYSLQHQYMVPVE